MAQSKKVIFWSIVVALGGFLFGFDTAVISGAERTIQELWNLTALQQGFTVSIALIGTVFGALLGGIPSDKWGRKKTLIFISLLYLISAVGSALATGWYAFLFFRFIGGLGVGNSSVTAPLYISEISPAKSRGRLVALFQFNIVFGILIAYLSNYLIGGDGANDWRWMLGVEAFPALVFLVTLFYIPESPRWLIIKHKGEGKARATLEISNPGENVDQIIKDIHTSAHEELGQRKVYFFSGRYSKPIMLAVLMAVFNQVSGINAIIYYAPRIFEIAGLGKSAALLSSAGIGLVNLIFTVLAIFLIDNFGRRKLMLVGSVGLIVVLALVAFAFNNSGSLAVPIYLFLYIAFFAFSQGAVIWVFISEIFPNKVRAYGQSLGSFTHWFMAAIIAWIFPYIVEALGPQNTFLFFCGMMILQLLFVIRLMPETKGTSLEQIERKVVED